MLKFCKSGNASFSFHIQEGDSKFHLKSLNHECSTNLAIIEWWINLQQKRNHWPCFLIKLVHKRDNTKANPLVWKNGQPSYKLCMFQTSINIYVFMLQSKQYNILGVLILSMVVFHNNLLYHFSSVVLHVNKN